MKIYEITNVLNAEPGFFSENPFLAVTLVLAGIAVIALIWRAVSTNKAEAGPQASLKSSSGTENTVEVPGGAPENEMIIAAITAAISAYYAASGAENKGFRVVSFKRADRNLRPWNSK